jgi:hypothetical protein
MATSKTTAAKKKKKKLTKSGVPRKWSDAWWAEYWNAEYEMLRRSLREFDKYLLMTEMYCINGNIGNLDSCECQRRQGVCECRFA